GRWNLAHALSEHEAFLLIRETRGCESESIVSSKNERRSGRLHPAYCWKGLQTISNWIMLLRSCWKRVQSNPESIFRQSHMLTVRPGLKPLTALLHRALLRSSTLSINARAAHCS